MSDPIELGFRQRVAAEFAADLAGRVYELVLPPDTTLPAATYRRVAPGEETPRWRTARLQLMLYDVEYTDVKRLQARIEERLKTIRGTWLSAAGDDCPVWVYLIKPYTMPDAYQTATRRRVAISEFEIKYATV